MAYTQAQWNSFQASLPPEDRISYLEYLQKADPAKYAELQKQQQTLERLKADSLPPAVPAAVDEQTKRAAMKADAAAQKAAGGTTVKKPSTYAQGMRIDAAGNYVGYNPEMEGMTSASASATENPLEAANRAALAAEAAAQAARDAEAKNVADAQAAAEAEAKRAADAAAAAAAAQAEADRLAKLTKEQKDAEAKAAADAAAKAAAEAAEKARLEAAAVLAAAQKAAADAAALAAAQAAAAEAALAQAATAAELAAAKAAAIAANEAVAQAQANAAALAAKAAADAKAQQEAAEAALKAALAGKDAEAKAAAEKAAADAKTALEAAVAEAKRLAAVEAAAAAAANLNVAGNQVIPDSDEAAAAALAAEQQEAADKLAKEQKEKTDKLLANATGKRAYDLAIAAGKTPAEAATAAEAAIAEFTTQQQEAAEQAEADAAAQAAADAAAAEEEAAELAKLTEAERVKREADAKAIAEKEALDKAKADAAAAAKMAMRESTIKLLTDRFTKYGLDSLTQTIKDLAIDGASEDTITLTLSETDAYKDRFKANEERRKKGLAVLDPGTYLRTEDSYRQVLREYGLKQFDNDESVSKFIANDVSPAMMSKRIVTAVQRVQNADPAISKQLRDYYGIGQEDLVAYVLDPEQQFEKIERQIAASEIGVAAARQGLQAGVSVAEQLAAQGITEAQAQKGYATIADYLPDAEKLSGIYGGTMDKFGQAEAEQLQFNSLASAQRKREALRAREIAAFSGSSGTNRTSLTTSSVGQFQNPERTYRPRQSNRPIVGASQFPRTELRPAN